METPAQMLHREIDRLINLVEGKFQYIRDLQGDPITDPQLVRVVNAHGAVLYEIAKLTSVIGKVVEGLVDGEPGGGVRPGDNAPPDGRS